MRKQWRLSDETHSMFIDISTRDEENSGPYLWFGIDGRRVHTKYIDQHLSLCVSLSRHSPFKMQRQWKAQKS